MFSRPRRRPLVFVLHILALNKQHSLPPTLPPEISAARRLDGWAAGQISACNGNLPSELTATPGGPQQVPVFFNVYLPGPPDVAGRHLFFLSLLRDMDWLSSKGARLSSLLVLLHSLLLFSPVLGFAAIPSATPGCSSYAASAPRRCDKSSLGCDSFFVRPGSAADAITMSSRRGLSQLSMSMSPSPPVKPVST